MKYQDPNMIEIKYQHPNKIELRCQSPNKIEIVIYENFATAYP